jgi:ABC-2 type transport system permease protein
MTPYISLFATQFQLMLQYRAAAFAGFVTQCWWGGIKVMVLTAFFAAGAAADASMTLTQVISYVWLAQAFLVLQPWFADAEVTAAVRTGAIGFERVRPVDTYSWWYARAAATMMSKAVPRAALMVLFAGLLLPAAGLGAWGLKPPPTVEAASAFALSLALVVLLSAAFQMLINVVVVATLTDKGANLLIAPFVILFSGGEIPLPLMPDWLHLFLFVQPLAGIVDIPFRIYAGHLAGDQALAGLALQAFWIAVLVALGRAALVRALRKLEVQGG